MALYVGFDSSTQSLTATAIEVTPSRREVLFEHTMPFDATLPGYGTRRGVLPGADPHEVVAPPLLWVEALDRMMAWIAASGLDLSQVRAVSGSAQQHGSVYLAQGAGHRLTALDERRPLVAQMAGVFSRAVSPVWMDSSTTAECRAIEAALGGAEPLAQLTGSRAFERFTGPQIRKFATRDPASYARTERIHLVSSFLASLLAGCHAPIEPGDGSGMNLMELSTARWHPEALAATADGLESKLPALAPSWTVVGRLAPYWQRRHGWPAARVIAWSGDNPCSLVGVGLVSEGRLAISLGTSDTVFGVMRAPRVDPSGTGHVFGAPTGDFLGLTCFQNGSLARERIRDDFGLDWSGFSEALRATPPGNHGRILLPWLGPEITPTVHDGGLRRYGLGAGDGPGHVRGIVEAQMLAMATHSQWMGVTVDVIHATGGAAVNRDVLAVMADVFGADVYQLDVGNSAALGAALRARHADARADGRSLAWEDVIAGFVEPGPAGRVRPRPEHVGIHRAQRAAYLACEAHGLGRGPDPREALEAFAHALVVAEVSVGARPPSARDEG